jgi:hypothetical protein
MTFNEFVKIAEARFGIEIRIYKSKAGHEMINIYMDEQVLCSGSITGPDAGYACPFGRDYAITIFGWAYALDTETGEWYLTADGRTGWREGSNPFPEIPEQIN